MSLAHAQLDEVDRQIAALREDLEKQWERVAVLKADGGDAAEAEELLGQAARALQKLIDFREVIFRALPE